MKIVSTLNNERIKFLSSWVDNGNFKNNGIDILITDKGKILLINWLRYNRTTILW